MDTQTEALLSDIRAFLARQGMKETTFGLLAVNDGKFFGRLASGGNVTLKTVSRVREFMDTYKPASAASEGASSCAADGVAEGEAA